MAYASRTGTRRNLAALRRLGWRLMVSCAGVWRTEGFRYCLDNGAWTAHQQGTAWDAGRFAGFVALLGVGADFIVAPDVVMGGLESLRLSESWLHRLPGLRLVAVQNGMTVEDVRPLLGSTVGVFVGGDTAWKEATMPRWGRLARECGAYIHVGRVNSARRIRLCALAGADSFDGTSASRFACTAAELNNARNQQVLFTEESWEN